MSENVSEDFPVLQQVEAAPCEWCGKPLGQPPHGRGSRCYQSHVAFGTSEIAAGELEFAAALLRRKAGVFGEEPLEGAIVRVRLALARLEAVRETAKEAKPPIPGASVRTDRASE